MAKFEYMQRAFSSELKPRARLVLQVLVLHCNKEGECFPSILLENVPGLAPTSLLLLEQLRTIDRKRLRGYIGRISKEKMLEVDAALAISIGIGYPNERRTHNV